MAEQAGSSRRRRSFGPVVLTGLATAVLAAVAAGRDWARASGGPHLGPAGHVSATADGSSTAPLALSLALVALAAWGVVLVARGRSRRAVAAVGVLAAAGVLAATVVSSGRARRDAVGAVVSHGAAVAGSTASLTGWFYVCAAAAGVSAAAFVVAVVLAPGWPAMGSRYDAPAARSRAVATEQDMWRALDDGRDPTVSGDDRDRSSTM